MMKHYKYTNNCVEAMHKIQNALTKGSDTVGYTYACFVVFKKLPALKEPTQKTIHDILAKLEADLKTRAVDLTQSWRDKIEALKAADSKAAGDGSD